LDLESVLSADGLWGNATIGSTERSTTTTTGRRATRSPSTSSTTSISGSWVSVLDEVNFGLLWSTGSWATDLNVRAGLSFLEEDVDQVLVLVLFWENDLGLVGGGGGGGLDEDDVHVLVSSWDTNGAGLVVWGLIGGRVDVHMLEGLWGVGWLAVLGVLSSHTSHQGKESQKSLHFDVILKTLEETLG